MRKQAFAILAVLCLTSLPAKAQSITPDDVAVAFVAAVAICADAKRAGGSIADLSAEARAQIAVADESMRAMAQAPAGRPIWDVAPARGIVVISEPSDGECHVNAYGPRVRPVFEQTARMLVQRGFAESEARPDPSAIVRTFAWSQNERRVTVRLDGGEPGMPGHMFRFPLLVAFIGGN
jgi:hypothetical protein